MELCKETAIQALKDDVGIKEVLDCQRSWLIDEALVRYGTQAEAAKKLKKSRRVINYYLRGK